MTNHNNKKSFWQKYKYIFLFTLIIPVVLVIIRALRPTKTPDKGLTSQTDHKQNNTKPNTSDSVSKNTPATVDTTANDPNNKNVADNKDIKKEDAKTVATNNPYAKYYTPKLVAQKKNPIPSNVHFYYPPNTKKATPGRRKLTAPSPIKVTPTPKKTYKVEILPEPKAEILSNKVTIYSNVELQHTLLNRKLTKDANGLVKKIYKTKKGDIGEVEMELWILARHWQRNNGRMINKVYCTNQNGKLALNNLVDGRLYLEPFLNQKKVLFGALQQMPQTNTIEILDTEKKKFKSYNDQYNQYTWFKIKIKGYIKWQGASEKKEDKG